MLHDLSIDLDIKDNLLVTVTCKQLDSINLTATIYDNSVPADLTNYKCRLKALKSDNKPLIQNTDITINNNIVKIKCNEQLTVVSNLVKAELEFINTETGEKKHSFNINFKIVSSVLEVEGTVSKSTITLLEELDSKLDQVENIGDVLDEAIRANESLEGNISTGNTLSSTLEVNISDATNINNELSNNNSLATSNNTELKNTILDANSTKTALDNANTQATKNIEAMQQFGDVSQLSQTVTSIKTKTDKFTEDENGDLLYNGDKISADSTSDAVTTTPIIGLTGDNSNVQNCLEVISNKINNIKYVTGDKTYYVDGTNGSDDNDGSSTSKAFKTIEKAWNTIPVLFENNYTIKLIGTFSNDIILGGKIPLGDYCIEITSNSTSSKAQINKNFKMISLKGSPNPSFTTKATFKISYIDVIDSKITITGSQGVIISDSTITLSSGSVDHLIDVYGSDVVISYCTLNSSSSVGVFASTYSNVYCSMLKGSLNTGYYARYSSNITYGYNSITATTLTKTDYNGSVVSV